MAAACWLICGVVALIPVAKAGAQPVTDVQFFTPRTVLWLGHSQIIPVRTAKAVTEDQTPTARVADGSIAEVLREPAVLAGETVGYLRARGLRAGVTRLSIGNGAIDLDVRPDPAGSVADTASLESHRPRIVAPMPDAAVWGQFAIGVEVFEGDPQGPSREAFPTAGSSAPASLWKVQLRLPDGRLIDPAAQTSDDLDPWRRCVFSVHVEDLPAGPARFVAVATPDGVSEIDRRAGRAPAPTESDALVLNVQAREPDALCQGECKDVPAPKAEAPEPGRPAPPPLRQGDIVTDAAAAGGRAVSGTGNGPIWYLPFTVRTPGSYQLFVQARGNFAAGAYPSAALFVNSDNHPSGLLRIASSKYQRLPVGGPIHLGAGAQLLRLDVENSFHHGNQDRNLYLGHYELARVPEAAPARSPAPALAAAPTVLPAASSPLPPQTSRADRSRLAVLYPAEGAAVFGADAVVVQTSQPLAWVDLLVDDELAGVRIDAPRAGERLLLPLLGRGLLPGIHLVSVRAVDSTGASSDSPMRAFEVLAQPPAEAGRYERAVRLLNRFAFGPEPRELAEVLALGEREWLDRELAGGFDTPAEQRLVATASARYPNVDDAGQTIARVLYQVVGTDNPVRTRFTLWAENHFSTWIEKTGGGPKWREHLEFSRLGLAPFGDLLAASAHSPAMLVYLDQEKSFAGTLNENYAREVMELHTLGVHGGYRQGDVTSLARLLNGWTLANEAMSPEAGAAASNSAGETEAGFRFASSLNDGQAHRIFGIEFPAANAPSSRYDRVRVALEMLAAHPSTAEHICRQLAEHYTGTPAPAALVDDLSRVFLETAGDMRAVLRAMATDPAFWSAPPKLATPLDFSVRIARLCNAAAPPGTDPGKAVPPEQIEAFLKKSGMGLFDRMTPDGYPENGASYADSNALLQRWRFTQTLGAPLDTLVPAAWRAPGDGLAQRFVDLAAIRLTGRPLSPASNEAALGILGEPTPERMHDALIFVSLLPEANLR